jgi:hypothetical protein
MTAEGERSAARQRVHRPIAAPGALASSDRLAGAAQAGKDRGVFWLAYRGTREEPLPLDWFARLPEIVDGFGVARGRTPHIAAGDKIIWYATRRGVVFGVAEVTDAPQLRVVQSWQGTRWPWWVATRTKLIVPDLRTAPTLVEAGLGDVRVTPGSYRGITRMEFDRASHAIEQCGGEPPTPPTPANGPRKDGPLRATRGGE